MPTYRNGNFVKVTAPKTFTDSVKAAEAPAIIDAKLANMKFNLDKNQYDQLFNQWNRMKQESSQRLQKIEQYNNNKYQEQKQKQLRHQQQYRKQQEQQPINTEPNPSSTSTVIRNLEFMRKVVRT